AFLYAPLKEEIYIKTPEGSLRKAPYLRLKKLLYGLKQAPANWFETLTSWFEDINFHQSTSNPCLFIHKDKHTHIFFHVDDQLVVGNVDAFEELFLNRFPNSTAHSPNTLLGMDVSVGTNHIFLSQVKLIDKGLEMLGMTDCKPVKTPLSQEFAKLAINYRTYTGILNYLSRHNTLERTKTHFNIILTQPGPMIWKLDSLRADPYCKRTSGSYSELKNCGMNPYNPQTFMLIIAHLDIKMKWLRDLKLKDEICVTLVPSEDMVADNLTKASCEKSLT
ncbi:uncharacterized protein VP01_6916g1, partial [Puccinia sorghi]